MVVFLVIGVPLLVPLVLVLLLLEFIAKLELAVVVVEDAIVICFKSLRNSSIVECILRSALLALCVLWLAAVVEIFVAMGVGGDDGVGPVFVSVVAMGRFKETWRRP